LRLIQATALCYLLDSRISPTATLKTVPVTSQNMSLLLADKFVAPRPTLLAESSHVYCTVWQALVLVYCNLYSHLAVKAENPKPLERKQLNFVSISQSSPFLESGDLHPISITTQYVNFKELKNRGAEEDTSA
jgi:hypothetical protein